jgi:hypothetical protein
MSCVGEGAAFRRALASSLRKQGPIRRGGCNERRCSTAFAQQPTSVVMGPRLRGDDSCGYRGVAPNQQSSLRAQAKQSIGRRECSKRRVDCFVASAFARRRASADKSAPRNDGKTWLRDLAAWFFCARYSCIPALSNEGAGNAGRPMRPIAACAMVVVERTRVSRVHRNHPAFPTQWFTDYTCAPRCSGFLATVTPEKLSLPRNLTPASRCQDYTTSPSARKRPRLEAPLASTASCPALVTLANAPRVGQDGSEYSGDLHFGKAEYFFWRGWTRRANQGMRRKVICPSGQISLAIS